MGRVRIGAIWRLRSARWLYRPPRGNGEPQPPASWYAAAQRSYEAGADGIYTFNLFPAGASQATDYPRTVLSRIGTRATLKDADKLYCISDAGNYMPAHYWSKDAEEFGGALPVQLKAEQATSLPPLVVADKLDVSGDRITAELRLEFTGLGDASVPHVLFNRSALKEANPAKSTAGVLRFSYSVPPPTIRSGENQLALTVRKDGVSAVGAELWLRRGSKIE